MQKAAIFDAALRMTRPIREKSIAVLVGSIFLDDLFVQGHAEAGPSGQLHAAITDTGQLLWKLEPHRVALDVGKELHIQAVRDRREQV